MKHEFTNRLRTHATQRGVAESTPFIPDEHSEGWQEEAEHKQEDVNGSAGHDGCWLADAGSGL